MRIGHLLQRIVMRTISLYTECTRWKKSSLPCERESGICVPNMGGKNPFSVLMTATMPDLHFNESSQCFPRYRYPKPADTPDSTDTFEGMNEASGRIDNISDTALRAFREHYSDDTITKDALFDYVYGVLHAPSYGTAFANDLSKMIPRIPFVPDFHAFAEAGRRLANFTSATRGVNGIRLRSYSHMKGNRCLDTSY